MSALPAQSTPPVRQQTLRLAPDERWALVGKTGSGKSVFALWLLRRWRAKKWRVLVIDPYLRFAKSYAEKPEEATLDKPWVLKTGQLLPNCPVQLYKPSMPGWHDGTLSEMLMQCVREGGVVVDIEELKAIATASSIPPGLSELYTAGRKAPAPVISQTQSPRRVPSDMLAQSEWIVTFRLNRPADRAYMAEYMGDQRVEAPIERYAFWIHNEQEDGATLMRPLPANEVKR